MQQLQQDPEIKGIAADSRQVHPGFLFAALPGTKTDGSAYIADAVALGAVAVLARPGVAAPVPVITDQNPRRRLALMAACFYADQPRTIAAVTGTAGKTSVAAFTRQLWATLGEKAASIGTLGFTAPGVERAGALTTPDPIALHADLAQLAHAGVDHLAIEASSHGLDQCRLDGLRIAAAAFTNLGRDHLDYHPTMQAYRAAKLRLFAEVMATGGVAVLNADSPEFDAFRDACAARRHRVIAYGRRGADVRLDALAADAEGQTLKGAAFGRDFELRLRLAGAFQALNALCALGLAVGTGADLGRTLAAVGTLGGVRGRIELVGRHKSGAPVYVDYAHKPEALEAVLGELRAAARGRLSVVFGCGGDRDKGKRPIMGEIAARLSDRATVTDDNPRSEDAGTIRRAILAGVPGPARGKVREIGDRRAAIAAAISELSAGDVLVIAGKGHEQGQTVGTTVLPFDDAEEARAALAALARKATPFPARDGRP